MILMSQNVSDGGNASPMNFRPHRLEIVGQPPGSLRYDFNCPLNDKTKLPIVLELIEALAGNLCFDPRNGFEDVMQRVIDLSH
jgi:hypothetical protein